MYEHADRKGSAIGSRPPTHEGCLMPQQDRRDPSSSDHWIRTVPAALPIVRGDTATLLVSGGVLHRALADLTLCR
jgi:hypothetical protein